jgi:uncharacterized membrane protein YkoI
MFYELSPMVPGITFRMFLGAETSPGPGHSKSKSMIVVAIIELIIWLALGVVPTSVFAREFGETSVAEPADGFSQSESAGTIRGTRAFENVRVPIRRAIAIAESRAAGAKIFDIGFDEESDQIAYRVKTYQNNEIWTGTIDGSTGEIIGEGVVTPVARLERREKAELANLKRSGMDLSEAISIAEQYGAGSAVGAGLEEQKGRPIFVVEVVADGRLKEVSVEMARSFRVNKRTVRKGTRRSSIIDEHCKISPSAMEQGRWCVKNTGHRITQGENFAAAMAFRTRAGLWLAQALNNQSTHTAACGG